MADWDLLLTNTRVATLCRTLSTDGLGADPYGTIADGAIAIANGRLAWVGPRSALPAKAAAEERSLGGAWVTPALVDCHTHIVFGGDRADEYERRLAGERYEDIA
ncbi:MAG TPA: imidazolonepropionase, partial [Woeseiaceae bacterium]|nr:imidazolonepropionase [Woeseiaceae bacterium]